MTNKDGTDSISFTAPSVAGPASVTCVACNVLGDCAAPMMKLFIVRTKGYQ